MPDLNTTEPDPPGNTAPIPVGFVLLMMALQLRDGMPLIDDLALASFVSAR